MTDSVHMTTVDGVVATSEMTGREIFNLHLEKLGEKPVSEDSRRGPPLHTHASHLGGLMSADAPAKPATPVKPAEPPAPKLTEFRETPAPAPAAQPAGFPPGPVDDAGIDALHKAFAKKVQGLEGMPQSAARDAELSKVRALYQEELVEFLDGRRLNERRSEFRARRDGTAPAVTPEQAAYNTALEKAVAAQDANGAIMSSAIAPELLSGYAIPSGVYTDLRDLVEGLKIARKQGFSQAKVDKILRETLT